MSLLALRAVGFVAGLAASVATARSLGPRGYGIYASAAGIAAVVVVLGPWGLDQMVILGRASPREASKALRVVALISVVGCGLAAIAWPRLSPQARWAVLLLGISGSADLLRRVWLAGFQHRLDFRGRAWRELATQGSMPVVGATIAIATHSAVLVAAAMCSLSLLLVLPVRALPSSTGGPTIERRSLLRSALPFSLSAALYTIYFQIDLAMLAALRPAQDVASYRVAYVFVTAAVLLPVSLNNDVMRPRLQKSMDVSANRRIVRGYGALSAVSGILAALLVWLAGPLALRLLFGRTYDASSSLLPLLAAALLPHYINSWAGNVLVAVNRVSVVLIVQSTLAVCNIALNIALIPGRGPRGAATATLVTEAAGVGLYAAGMLWVRRSARQR